MGRQEKVLEKKKLGRPAIGKGVQVNMQLRPEHAAALDQWRGEQDPPIPSRGQAARIAVEDWLRDHGLLKNASKHLKPKGPATDAFDKMRDDIEKDRSARKKKS